MTKEIVEGTGTKNDCFEISDVKGNCERLLVDARGAAALLGISRTNWLTRYQMGQTPEPIRNLGRRVLWRLAELRAWVDAGCPNRYNWQWKGTEV